MFSKYVCSSYVLKYSIDILYCRMLKGSFTVCFVEPGGYSVEKELFDIRFQRSRGQSGHSHWFDGKGDGERERAREIKCGRTGEEM